jgi:hypothetical protein
MAKKVGGDNSSEQAGGKWRGVVVALAVLVISIAAWYFHGSDAFVSTYQQSVVGVDDIVERKMAPPVPPAVEQRRVPARPESPGTANKKMNYDDYVAVAVAKDWSPSDPLEKLTAIISNFKSISSTFPSRKMTDTAELQRRVQQSWKMFQFHQQETDYLLEVLRQPLLPASTGVGAARKIDITGLYFTAADNLQKCVYSHIKFLLSESTEGMSVSKLDVEQGSAGGAGTQVNAKLCYFPFSKLLAFAGEIAADRSTGDHKLDHLRLDVLPPTESLDFVDGDSLTHLPDGKSLLEVVVRSRLGRVLPGVAELCSSLRELLSRGMRTAVIDMF